MAPRAAGCDDSPHGPGTGCWRTRNASSFRSGQVPAAELAAARLRAREPAGPCCSQPPRVTPPSSSRTVRLPPAAVSGSRPCCNGGFRCGPASRRTAAVTGEPRSHTGTGARSGTEAPLRPTGADGRIRDARQLGRVVPSAAPEGAGGPDIDTAQRRPAPAVATVGPDRGADRSRRLFGGIRVVVGVAGELLLTLGVIVFLFIGYELYGTGLQTAHDQQNLRKQLDQQFHAPPPGISRGLAAAAPQPGDAVALLTIPRLGPGYGKAVVEGVSHEDLKKGPGHYPGTALPGALGNTVLSGHRTTYGAPFGRLDELRVGDPIVLRTRAGTFTYRVLRSEVVDPTDIAVILPVPRHPGAAPAQRLLTLTTCTPKYSARQRLIVTAVLDPGAAASPGG